MSEENRAELKHIFLSYRSSEAEFALKFAADLKNAGVNLWMDRLDILPGQNWVDSLQQAVDECEAMIAVLSPQYVRSRYCQRELARADRLQRPIFPVLLEEIDDREVPFAVESKQQSNFTQWRDEVLYRQELERFVATLKSEVGNQVGGRPDAETRYLTSLIAELEAEKGVMEYVELSGHAEVPDGVVADTEAEPMRPPPRAEESWGLNGSFTLLEDVPLDEGGEPGWRGVPLDDLGQALEKFPRFVLIGPPGSGKTTTVLRLALDMAHARLTNRRKAPLPVLLRLQDWDDDSRLSAFVKNNWPLETNPIKALVKENMVLLLDGLNELQPARAAKADALQRWLHGRSAPKRVIVTCRLSEYFSALNLGLPTIMAEEMDEHRIRRFVTNYMEADAADALLSQVLPHNDGTLVEQRHLFWLARNPYILNLLMAHYPDGQLPHASGLLVEHLIAELWARERERNTPGWAPWEEVERAFMSLAMSVINLNLPGTVLRDYALQYLGDETLLQLGASANILAIEGYSVRFYHPLFQEYLAATALAQQEFHTKLMRPTFDHRGQRVPRQWDPVFIMLAGLAPNPDTMIREIAEVDPFLAVECIASGLKVEQHTDDHVFECLLTARRFDGHDGRVSAAQLLRQHDGDMTREILLEAMRDGAWEVRRAAFDTFRTLEAPAVPGLIDALSVWDQNVRDATAPALRQFGDTALPALLRMLRDEQRSLRRAAAWALGELNDPAVVPALVEALDDEDHLVRKEAALALRLLQDADSIAGLLDGLQDESWRVCKAAAHTLGWLGEMAVPGLSTALLHENPTVRRMAIEALGNIGGEQVAPALLEGLEDKNADVRGAAVDALRKNKEVTAVPALIERLADTAKPRWIKERVCDMAAAALEHIGTPQALQAASQWRLTQAVDAQLDAAETEEPPDQQPANAPRTKPARSKIRSAGTLKTRFKAITGRARKPKELSELLDALDEPDWNIRKAAVEGLGKLGDVTALPMLLEMLNDEDTNVRESTVKALKTFQDSATLDGLLRALYDEEHVVRDAAVEALIEAGSAAVPGLLAAGETANVDIRGAAIEALGAIGDDSAVPLLLRSLSDNTRPWMANGRISDLAAAALEQIGTDEALAAVSKWRSRQPVAVNGAAATEMHNESERREIITELLTGLQSSDWPARHDAAKALRDYARNLQNSDNPAIVQVLSNALYDDNWEVRWAVTEALAWIRNPMSLPVLVERLDDGVWMVRVAAIRALIEISDASVAPEVIMSLNDEHELVREVAVEALGVFKDSTAVPSLIEMLEDPHPFVRRAVCEALGKIRDAHAVPYLTPRLSDDDVNVRWTTADALGKICDARAIPALIERLADTTGSSWEDDRVCDVAARALECIDTPEAKAAVYQWRQRQAES